MTWFHMSVKLANEAMRTPDDVACALRGIADRLEGDANALAEVHAPVFDANGNRVGAWAFANTCGSPIIATD